MLREYSPALISDFVDQITKVFSSFSFEGAYGFVEHVLNFNYEDYIHYLDFTQHSLHFDEQQIKLLTILASLFTFNVLSIGLMWKSNGTRVFKKFKKPATRKVIEELKRSVDQLKLPKVHSPRI